MRDQPDLNYVTYLGAKSPKANTLLDVLFKSFQIYPNIFVRP